MRFLFFDRILELEPGARALATKSVSVSDECLPEHYRRRPVMPVTLVVEALAQLAGWLHTITQGFAIRTVLGLMEGVRVFGEVKPGVTLLLEVWTDFAHKDGATLHGEARVDGQVVLSVERFLFASRPEKDAAFIQKRREVFRYMSGDFRLPGEPAR